MSIFASQQQHDTFIQDLNLQNATYAGNASVSGWTQVDPATLSPTLQTEAGHALFYDGGSGAQAAVFSRTVGTQTEVVISLRGSDEGGSEELIDKGQSLGSKPVQGIAMLGEM